MNEKKLILFDGVCNLCNSSVNFIIDRDKKDVFRFASLQSEKGRTVIKQFSLPEGEYDSFLLLEKGKLYMRSTAALRVAKHLSGLWTILYVFIVVPKFIRDFIYNLIAKKRYKWFGKTETCRIPTPELKAKFIEQ
ncbi:MAG: thiol-disulfide oxidoreductase DCC family protein [Ignavibacteriaceae bacterium]|jgi:predicted DCC family thiol-disulfide oxidoreductase YuxK|nr:MAG: thiol-disulfide oxidoreductase DCC family protein [Chlorobiota bacterium]KXK06202.1 MAG: hypothetical protein UZ04_CHB001000204 [Chlorobi bacterium OLB4]MBV6399284.1 hypothetical protein [Ignavibacteria bacterium]MCC6884957.1 thiol-disulfide oxidoreductase DCC family protein [Ignavibacteriales bacterium]MCE7953512.1 thiol-disulfide oxidoreductase DCC family protein [Chlorobi bacterium CHB7]MDL1887598.1 thiol-disulfide oxidoreductase DCC family protein [Ignavibacteria bacterium CHB1]ME